MMNNNLTVQNINGALVVDSREVAEMVGKNHSDLLRSITGYCNIMSNANLLLTDYYIPSEYEDKLGRSYKCYLLTKKGCDMVANKMTGAKGVLFTATYIEKFYAMEKALQEQQPKLPTNFKEALLMLVQAEEEKEALLLENAQVKQIV